MPSGPLIFIVTAPSGTGKSTIVSRAIRSLPNLRLSVSCTTREPRTGEQSGIDYHFLSDEQFDRMLDQGRFLEWVEIHGHRYGTSRDEIEKAKQDNVDLILDIEGQGAVSVMKDFPEAIGIFLLPPSLSELKARMEKRAADRPEDIQRRCAHAKKELTYLPHYRYVVINDDLDEACRNFEAIIRCHRTEVLRQADATTGWSDR